MPLVWGFWGEAVFDAEVAAELIERAVAAGRALAQAEQAVGEFLPVIGQDRPDRDWAGAFQIAQKAAGIGGGLGFEGPDDHPAGGPVNRHEQIAARGFVSHLRQIRHIDMTVAGLVGLERLVRGTRSFRLQVTQIAHPMPPQTPVEARARDIRAHESPDRRQHFVKRHHPCFAHNHRHRLLRRGQGRLQAVRRMACGHAHYRDAYVFCRPAQSSRTAPPRLTQAPCWPGSPRQTFGVVVACL